MTKTINYYNEHAQDYFIKTGTINFEDKQQQLLKYLSPGNHILDFGCGSGRDALSFIKKGYRVTALDGSIELCNLASQRLQIPVRCQEFKAFNDQNQYDAIFACASLLHVSSQELPMLFNQLAQALKSEGYLYVSFKYGTFEGVRDGRYFTDFTIETFEVFQKTVQLFNIVEYQVTTDTLGGRDDLSWLNVILKKLC